ncbi:SDR family oxidoreductase [Quadrisphaera setariae]|nr:SDR family oxidoreductase [Quadrisphaera setariae]
MTSTPELIDPTTRYPQPEFDQEAQPGAGQAWGMDPTPDHGEESYRGSGKLTGRRALVTGGDSGIGRAAAIAFAREGADVAISYLPEEQQDADSVIAIIQKEGVRALALPGDITDEAFATSLVTKTVEAFGGIDVLVNNAGKQQARESILDISSEQFDETFKTNVYAMFWITKEAVKHLPAGSSIINTTSVQAYQPSPTLVDYASTKATINAFTKALAAQLAEKGIRVNAVAPGPVWTPLQPAGGQPESALPEFGAQTPLGRPGQPAEYGAAYVHLASNDSSYTTGSTLSITGGMPTP